MLFDDELIAYAWDKQYFSKPRYAKINQQENAMAIGEPFLRVPNKRKDMGVVLVHGFLASPAELRTLGERLEADGYAVLGVRLKGHGTSPWDLRERSWQDWLESVRRGYDIMSAFASRICMVGFSTGAALSLRLAAEAPRGLAGVAAVAAPLKFRNKNMVFVPLVHGANRLVRWVSSFEGIMPFRQNDSEHPNINYRNMPLRGLYELRRMVDDLQTRLEDVQCPVTVIQGTDDPVVEPQSAQLIVERLGSQDKTLTMVASNRHGILNEDVGGTQGTVLAFLDALSR
jgi:esterase/lipase